MEKRYMRYVRPFGDRDKFVTLTKGNKSTGGFFNLTDKLLRQEYPWYYKRTSRYETLSILPDFFVVGNTGSED